MKTSTVKALGFNLPAARIPFSVLNLTGRREKAIYQIMNAKPGLSQNLPGQVRACLAVLLESYGPTQFPVEQPGQPIQVEQRQQLFDSLRIHLGDAYYMYCLARIKAMGPKVKMTLTCPNCSTDSTYTIDLNDLAVDVAESEADLAAEITLSSPVSIGDKQYTKAKIQGMSYRQIKLLDDISQAKMATVAECATLVGYEFPLPVEIIEDWPSTVINELNEAINKLTPGINSIMTFKCGECNSINPYRVGWEFTSFFV
jgi:hypothetical protein